MTSTILTSSAVMLDLHPAAYPAVFSNVADVLFFDEGPRVNRVTTKAALTGAIDTSASDPYVQGVELKRQSQYDAGFAKIWSGEAGHLHKSLVFGQEDHPVRTNTLVDKDRFDPVTFIKLQVAQSIRVGLTVAMPVLSSSVSAPIRNGVLDPLPRQTITTHFISDTPVVAQGVKGALAAGNTNPINGSDRVLTVDYFEPAFQIPSYIDSNVTIDNRLVNVRFHKSLSGMLPFNDQRFIRNEPAVNSEPSDFIESMSLMTGSTDNYVRYDQRSATCGWYYDNTVSVGTDSLAFGGMTY